jgi:GNAT superfamily N-acetyltransferase
VENFKIRLFEPTDDVAQLNTIIRAAYQSLADAGMRYHASYEDVAATQRQIRSGECYLALLDEKIIGCVVLRIPPQGEKPAWMAKRPAWYSRDGVASFGRFAVLPELQGKGYGAKILDFIEQRVKNLGFSEIALDTSERAHHLIQMYEKRGYRFVEYFQWEVTNYRSVVLSKKL